MFLGQLNDRPAIVIALFGEHGLTKVMVSLPTQEDSTMDVYREMRKVLGGEYGSPALEVERYAYPFANGQHVGFEMAALRPARPRSAPSGRPTARTWASRSPRA